MRATVIMNDGASLEEEAVKKAITDKGIEFEGFEMTEIERPQVAYQLVVEGAT